ncbi:MAG: amino acid ABC transporter permease [Candidatus Adiutrix sp.]|jgi:polar amino acid transport system permease protein|nr:amino acid ABC transporter permease [Candidatus Adiutrix sp.]
MNGSKKAAGLTAGLGWLITMFLLGLLLFKGALATGYGWDWARVPAFFFDWDRMRFGPLLKGLGVTCRLIAWSLLLTLFLGLATALARLLGGPVLAGLARLYLEIIRNTPLLVQLSVTYFIWGAVFDFSAFWAAVLALSLFEGAYLSEIFRSGFLAVDQGQWQAAWCLGLSTPDTFGKIILPQTAPMLWPPICSLVISLVKDSALASTIAVYELTKEARDLAAETFLSFELWLTIAGIYLSLNLLMSALGALLERRLGRL